jgi:hypothetical protein
MVADQSSMTIAPSSITIVLSLPAAPLVAIFTLFGELPSSTSENGLLVPLDVDEVPLVILAGAVSWVPLDGCEGFFLRGIGEAGVSISGAAGAGRSTPLIGLSSRASLLKTS